MMRNDLMIFSSFFVIRKLATRIADVLWIVLNELFIIFRKGSLSSQHDTMGGEEASDLPWAFGFHRLQQVVNFL